MFGGFGRRKERDVGELKRQQLEALKQQVPQVRAVNAVSRWALPLVAESIDRSIVCLHGGTQVLGDGGKRTTRPPSYAPSLPYLPTSFYGPIAQEETVLDVPIPSASSTAVLRVQLSPQFPDHAPGAFYR